MSIHKYLLLILLCGFFSFANSQQSSSIDSYQDFDFWIGEWNVYKFGTDTLVGQSKITSILNGKAIQENYQSSQGPFEGTSLNMYNKANGHWEQYWVDNSGLRLNILGGLKEGTMVMESDPGMAPFNRISWSKEANGEVRQIWEQKKTKGDSWLVVFDGIYRPKI